MLAMSEQLFNVKLKSQDKHYECSLNDSVLEGGLRHGLAMRYECSNGTCGVCKARLSSGNLKKIKHHDYSLSDDEMNNQEFLMCCHAPESDIELEVELIGDVKSIAIQTIQTKVKEINFVDNMAIVTLRTPRSQTLQFMAGQDVELSFKGNTSRYPIASCPCHGMELEFHIRHLEDDNFSRALFTKSIKSKSKVDLVGPKGVFVLKELSNKPMMFIAWDGGFAPIRSLVEHAFSLEMPNPVNFYWAYPSVDSKPYLDNHANSWQVVMEDYYYTSIACEFDRNSKNDCRQVAKQIFNALDLEVAKESDIYICAPAEVLIFLSELLLENGVDESQLIGSPI